MNSLSIKHSITLLAACWLWCLTVHAQPGSYGDIALAPAGEYELDKTHGYITFSYLHQGYSRPWLRFREVSAILNLDPKEVSNSTVSVNIDPASIDSGVDVFDEHLRDKKMFNVAEHPEITFTSTSVNMDGENITLVGDLMMMGVTKPLTLTGTFNKGGLHFKSQKPMLGFSASGKLNRKDWNLGYAVPIVGNEVSLVIEVEFWKK